MKRGFTILPVLIIAVLIIVVISCFGYQQLKPRETYTTYINTRFGYSFEYPEDYLMTFPSLEDREKVDQGGEVGEVEAIKFYNQEGEQILFVGASPNPDNLNPSEFVDFLIKQRDEGHDSFDYTSREDVIVSDGTAHALINKRQDKTNVELFYSLRNAYLLKISYEYNNDDTQRIKTLNEIIKSISNYPTGKN